MGTLDVLSLVKVGDVTFTRSYSTTPAKKAYEWTSGVRTLLLTPWDLCD